LYGRTFVGRNGSSMIYVCLVCKASVGTHSDGYTPLGRLANKELKALKKQAHALLDPHHGFDKRKRQKTYIKLAEKLGIPVDDCHIGHFDETMTLKAIAELETWRKPRKRVQ
jgi:DNA-binding LacI/PurR family transcriptional regulator